ncbi:hypothetical protein VTI74DRAFT_4859 [Chaetomium olivicolor]
MARLLFTVAAFGWLALAYPRTMEHHKQNPLTEGSGSEQPLPMAADAIREKLKEAEIIPDVIDDFHPSLGLHVTWWSKERALLGNTLKPEKLQDEPSIALHDIRAASPSSSMCSPSSAAPITYVVTLTDPDAPSRDNPKWSEYCHWIASGTLKPGICDPKDPGPCPPVLTDLNEVVKYAPPTPPEKTGWHRYVFLAFVPSNGTTEKLHLSKPGERKRWGYASEEHKGKIERKGVRKWAEENGLAPVGANFIYARNKNQ